MYHFHKVDNNADNQTRANTFILHLERSLYQNLLTFASLDRSNDLAQPLRKHHEACRECAALARYWCVHIHAGGEAVLIRVFRGGMGRSQALF